MSTDGYLEATFEHAACDVCAGSGQMGPPLGFEGWGSARCYNCNGSGIEPPAVAPGAKLVFTVSGADRNGLFDRIAKAGPGEAVHVTAEEAAAIVGNHEARVLTSPYSDPAGAPNKAWQIAGMAKLDAMDEAHTRRRIRDAGLGDELDKMDAELAARSRRRLNQFRQSIAAREFFGTANHSPPPAAASAEGESSMEMNNPAKAAASFIDSASREARMRAARGSATLGACDAAPAPPVTLASVTATMEDAVNGLGEALSRLSRIGDDLGGAIPTGCTSDATMTSGSGTVAIMAALAQAANDRIKMLHGEIDRLNRLIG